MAALAVFREYSLSLFLHCCMILWLEFIFSKFILQNRRWDVWKININKVNKYIIKKHQKKEIGKN